MPRVSRSRVIAAPPERVWGLVSDPHHLARWWPLAVRVEDVRDGEQPGELAWTVVLRSERGTTVRADFERGEVREGRFFSWRQAVEGTPFGRILRAAVVEVAIRADGAGCRVMLTSDETLRGMSRLGGTMIRNASRRRLDEALEGIERAVAGAG